MTDYADGQVDLFEKREDHQEQDNPERNRDVLTNYQARAPAQNGRVLDVLDFVCAGKRVAITAAHQPKVVRISGFGNSRSRLNPNLVVDNLIP
jgi:hypothetical protein